ncbi:hypothetical protein MMC17_004933 [Xylographa soralifera]|nr:hypothetical protein [Xylographa soralifera]
MPLDEHGIKWAWYITPHVYTTRFPMSASCIRGHRAKSCDHWERLMLRVKPPGRPLQNCPHPKDVPCSCSPELFQMVKIQRGGKCFCQPVGPNMPNGVSMVAGSSSMASPVDSPRSGTKRNSASHSRKRSWPHEDEERIRASKRSRQQCLVPKNGTAVAQPFPAMMFQSPQYLPPASQQAWVWPPQPNTQFNVALDPASNHIMDQIHATNLSTQGFSPYQPQHSQPMYSSPVSHQPEWIATTMQDEPCSVPPPHVITDNFAQFDNMNSFPGSDLIYSQHVSHHPIGYNSATQYSIPPAHAVFNQTFSFDQSHNTQQPPQSMLPMPMPFASTILSGSETLLETDERCECGPKCSCEGCGTHFDNVPTRNLVGNLSSILVKDDVIGLYEGQLLDYNQNSTSSNNIFPRSPTIAEATPGNLPSPADSISEDRVLCEGIHELELSEFAGGNRPKKRTRLPDYVTVGYSLDTVPVAKPGTTDLNAEADGGLFFQSFAAGLPVGEPINSVEMFSAPAEEFIDPLEEILNPAEDFMIPVGDFINPLGEPINPTGDFFTPFGDLIDPAEEFSNPVRKVIDLSADEDDPVSPTSLPSCCRN